MPKVCRAAPRRVLLASTAQSRPPLALPSPRCDHVGRAPFALDTVDLCLSRAAPDAQRHATNVRATARPPPIVLLADTWCVFAACALHGFLHHHTSSLLLETGDAHACVCACVPSCLLRIDSCVIGVLPTNHPSSFLAPALLQRRLSRSLIPTLNSTPPDTTCGVCVPFVGRFCSLWKLTCSS